MTKERRIRILKFVGDGNIPERKMIDIKLLMKYYFGLWIIFLISGVFMFCTLTLFQGTEDEYDVFLAVMKAGTQSLLGGGLMFFGMAAQSIFKSGGNQDS